MGILEDKISPFSNLKTLTTVLDSDGLTQNTGSVTLQLWFLHLCKLNSSAWFFTIALQLLLPSDQRWFILHL